MDALLTASASGNVYSWGNNTLGMLCVGNSSEYLAGPTLVSTPAAASVAIGSSHTLILLRAPSAHTLVSHNAGSGLLYGCGSNAFAQIAQPTADPILSAVPLGLPFSNLIHAVSAGSHFSLVLCEVAISSS
jgi:alpha-tubulin suppressor-like RCC1 family protein